MKHRAISAIAQDIKKNWANVNYGAVPYLNAMQSLNTITDNYGEDRADMVVRYFLGNARTWRGEDAKRIKTELKAML